MGVIEILFVMWYYQPLWLAHNKTGNCHYSLVSSPGSQVIRDLLELFQQNISNQVSVNFVEMLLPPQGSNGVCEAWVQLEEAEDHNLGSLIGGAIGQKISRYVTIFLV